MGYACPVCGVPQRDGEHLANHLAIVAMVHGDDHERWLDEHAPAWSDAAPEELAAVVAERAPPAEFDEAFEDTVHDHDRDDDDVDYGALFREDAPERPSSDRPTAPGPSVDANSTRNVDRIPDADRISDVGPAPRGDAAPDAEVRRVLSEARDLTREMLDGEDSSAEGHERVDGDAEGKDS